ncbi:ribonuclease H-like domain-containing protein [Tanacetum coccineum]
MNNTNFCLETVTQTLAAVTLRSLLIPTVLSLAVSRKWPIHQLDVKNAFLNDDLSENVYMHQPPGFVDNWYPHHVCLIQRSLYGLKQAPRAWFQQFASYATLVGFYHSRRDSSLFIYRQGSQVSYLLIYVDDIILTASCPALRQQIIGSLNNEFDMTDLGALNYFLGISADRTPISLFLSQKKYALQLLKCAHMVTCNPSWTPIDTESKLVLEVQQICLYMHDPREPHFAALKCILRYVGGLLPIYMQIRNLLCELHCPLSTATLVYCDNVSSVYMSANPVQHQWTKHIEIDIHFVRDMVTASHVRVLHVPSHFQYADIFTKGLPTTLFEDFRSSLSVRPPPAQTARAY